MPESSSSDLGHGIAVISYFETIVARKHRFDVIHAGSGFISRIAVIQVRSSSDKGAGYRKTNWYPTQILHGPVFATTPALA